MPKKYGSLKYLQIWLRYVILSREESTCIVKRNIMAEKLCPVLWHTFSLFSDLKFFLNSLTKKFLEKVDSKKVYNNNIRRHYSLFCILYTECPRRIGGIFKELLCMPLFLVSGIFPIISSITDFELHKNEPNKFEVHKNHM